MKIEVNSAKQYFEGCCQKKCLLKVWSFLVHPSQKGVPVKFIICARSDFPIKYSVFEKLWFTINGQSKMLFFNFCFFLLPKFQMTIVNNLKWILSVLSNFFYVTNIFDLHIFENETAALLIFFLIWADMHFVSLFFSKRKKHYNLPFDDTFKMYSCAL